MDRVTQLRSLIIKAKQAYYFGYFGGHQSTPMISDAAYDALEEELRLLSPNDPVLAMVGAPVPPDAILTKAKHKIAMGSQEKVTSEAEFKAWASKRGISRFHCSLKGDGASAEAIYENGYLVQAISRGDGEEGEDISASAVKFKGLPAYLQGCDGEPFSGSIRFEVILTHDDWKTIGGKNPRNRGNGIMGRKDGTEAEYLTAFAFDIIAEYTVFHTETAKSQCLEKMGINAIPWKLCESVDEVTEYFNETIVNRASLGIEVDGIVIKADSTIQQQTLGVHEGKPKGQVAWKPESMGAITTLLGYEITGGHLGALIPNGRLQPVDIGGVTISNVLLNNFQYVNNLGLAVGDRVFVTRRNDVIPFVEMVVEECYTCPECGFRGTLEAQMKHHQST